LFDSLAKQQLLLNELTSGIAAGRAKANQSVLDAKTDRTTALRLPLVGQEKKPNALQEKQQKQQRKPLKPY
jgi:hypothetical protein